MNFAALQAIWNTVNYKNVLITFPAMLVSQLQLSIV